MRKFYLTIIAAVFIYTGCDSFLSVEEKPNVNERDNAFCIKLVDSTNTLSAVYGTYAVANATITMKSNLLGTVYKMESDEYGLVRLSNILSDKYLITASRNLTADEMEIAVGEKRYNNILVNFSQSIIELRADLPDTLYVSMDKIIVQSPIVISEIYACGPIGSGLYFHDKYIELYNQTDEVQYLDGILVGGVYHNAQNNLSYVDDQDYVHVDNLWQIPGNGTQYPIQPGEFVVLAGDAFDHRINAPNSVDLSHAGFDFYKWDASDIDYAGVPNMKMIYQNGGVDWSLNGETGAVVILKAPAESWKWENEHYKIPNDYVLDGVEYMGDVTMLNKKALYPGIDAGATGGIEFYTGKSMERALVEKNGKLRLKDSNNSSIDFKVNTRPTPGYHNEIEL